MGLAAPAGRGRPGRQRLHARMRDEQSTGWAGACAVTWRSGGRKRGGILAAEASNYGHSPPTPVSGDPY